MSGTAPPPSVGAALFTPGAGSGRDHPALVAIEARLSPRPVSRYEFAYRTAGRPFPDRPPKLIAELEAESQRLATTSAVPAGSLVLGGRSMGGRMCSMAVAEGLPAAGLVLIGYPLHPPKKPEKRRVEHLGSITVPTLFVSGTRDDFGSPAELAEAHALVAGPVTVEWIEGGRHELKGADDEVADLVAGWVAAL